MENKRVVEIILGILFIISLFFVIILVVEKESSLEKIQSFSYQETYYKNQNGEYYFFESRKYERGKNSEEVEILREEYSFGKEESFQRNYLSVKSQEEFPTVSVLIE